MPAGASLAATCRPAAAHALPPDAPRWRGWRRLPGQLHRPRPHSKLETLSSLHKWIQTAASARPPSERAPRQHHPARTVAEQPPPNLLANSQCQPVSAATADRIECVSRPPLLVAAVVQPIGPLPLRVPARSGPAPVRAARPLDNEQCFAETLSQSKRRRLPWAIPALPVLQPALPSPNRNLSQPPCPFMYSAPPIPCVFSW